MKSTIIFLKRWAICENMVNLSGKNRGCLEKFTERRPLVVKSTSVNYIKQNSNDHLPIMAQVGKNTPLIRKGT